MENFNPWEDKPLSECTDKEIKKKLSFIPIHASQTYIQSLMMEATKRGIEFKVYDFF